MLIIDKECFRAAKNAVLSKTPTLYAYAVNAYTIPQHNNMYSGRTPDSEHVLVCNSFGFFAILSKSLCSLLITYFRIKDNILA